MLLPNKCFTQVKSYIIFNTKSPSLIPQASQNGLFEDALEEAWNAISGFSDASITVLTQHEVIVNNMFSTNMVYMITMNNAVVVDSMVAALPIADVEIDAEITDANGNAYELLEDVTVWGPVLKMPTILLFYN